MSDLQIKISTKTDVPPKLRSGELAFSYKSGKLYIGPSGNYNDPPNTNVIELLSTDRYISQNIQEGNISNSPSSDAVFRALQEINNINFKFGETSIQDITTIEFDDNLDVNGIGSNSLKISVKPYWGNIDIDDNQNQITPTNGYDNLKFKSGNAISISVYDSKYIKIEADIDDTNINGSTNKLWSSQKTREAIELIAGLSPDTNNDFTGINTFPDCDIINSEQTSKQVVNTSSLKGYVGTVATQILDGLSLIKFVFNNPSMNWLVQHNRNSTLFQKTLLDESDNEMMASVNIIDNNSFVVILTEAMSGSVLLRF